MSVQEQIKNYIASQPEPKSEELLALHQLVLRIAPNCKLWFLDGKNSAGKQVSNPNIGYGAYTIQYAHGGTREFYQVGLSANTTGISLYIMGLDDKTYLAKVFGKALGKSSVTGYCIKFKSIKDLNQAVLQDAIQYGFKAKRKES